MYDLCPHSTVSAKLYFFGKTTLITYLSFEEVQLHLRTEAIHKSVQSKHCAESPVLNYVNNWYFHYLKLFTPDPRWQRRFSQPLLSAPSL